LEAPAFEIPARKFHLFAGPLEAIEATFCTADHDEAVSMGTFVAYNLEEESLEDVQAGLADWVASLEPSYQSVNLWWPEDRAWCVATEIDFNTTYVAGTQRLVDVLLACETLEVYQVELTDGVAYNGDTLNPRPTIRMAVPSSWSDHQLELLEHVPTPAFRLRCRLCAPSQTLGAFLYSPGRTAYTFPTRCTLIS